MRGAGVVLRCYSHTLRGDKNGVYRQYESLRLSGTFYERLAAGVYGI